MVGDLEEHTRAIFVGEPTGGQTNHFGVSARTGSTSFVLPHSRLVIEYSERLPQLYGQVFILPTVPAELRHERSPAFVTRHADSMSVMASYYEYIPEWREAPAVPGTRNMFEVNHRTNRRN